jgi:hypothetical protein
MNSFAVNVLAYSAREVLYGRMSSSESMRLEKLISTSLDRFTGSANRRWYSWSAWMRIWSAYENSFAPPALRRNEEGRWLFRRSHFFVAWLGDCGGEAVRPRRIRVVRLARRGRREARPTSGGGHPPSPTGGKWAAACGTRGPRGTRRARVA